MHDRSAWTVLIPAAGHGVRLGRGPKALLQVGGRSAVEWVIDKASCVADDIVVGLPLDASLRSRVDCRFITGGASRSDTVRAMLALTQRQYVLIHDGARPFCSVDLMLRVAEQATTFGSAAAFLSSEVPIATRSGEWLAEVMPRDTSGTVHTPTAFRRDILEAAYARTVAGSEPRSTVELVISAGFRVRAIEGERTNLKITFPEDLDLAVGLADRLPVHPAEKKAAASR